MTDPRAAAFEATILPHLDAAYTLARHLLRDEHDAQDVVQDAMLRAWRHFDGYAGGSARAWLLAIVRHACSSARRPRAGDDTITFDEEAHGGAAAAPSQESAMDARDVDAAFRAALDALPPEFREVLVLREVEGMSYAEIALATSAPPGTVMSRLARARARLRRSLAPHTGEES